MNSTNTGSIPSIARGGAPCLRQQRLALAIALTAVVCSNSNAGVVGQFDLLTLPGRDPASAYGVLVSGIGDFDADGLSDFAVLSDSFVAGAPIEGSDTFTHIVYGTRGLSAGLRGLPRENGEAFVTGPIRGMHRTTAAAGDVNGDGFDDILFGAPYASPDAARTNAGEVYIVHGGSRAEQAHQVELDAMGTRIIGASAGDHLGVDVAAAGDVNGDGFEDIIVGANAVARGFGQASAGAAYVIFGPLQHQTIDLRRPQQGQVARLIGSDAWDLTGFAVSGAGDVNGDGLDDLVVGAPWGRRGPGFPQSGRAYVVFGSEHFPDADLRVLPPERGFRIEGESSFEYAGTSVSAAGDVNGDGLGDLIVGAWGRDRSPIAGYAGAAYVVFGRRDAGAVDLATPFHGFPIIGARSHHRMGTSVSGAGDVNGDGLADVMAAGLSTGGAEPGSNAAVAYIVYGKRDTDPVDLAHLHVASGVPLNGDALGNLRNARVGFAGDLDGNGASELLVGAPSSRDPGHGAAHLLIGETPRSRATTFRGNVRASICHLGAPIGPTRGRSLGRTGDATDSNDPASRLWIQFCARDARFTGQLASPRVVLRREDAPPAGSAPLRGLPASVQHLAPVVWEIYFNIAVNAAPSAVVTLKYTDAEIKQLTESQLRVMAAPLIGGQMLVLAEEQTSRSPGRNRITVRLPTAQPLRLFLVSE